VAAKTFFITSSPSHVVPKSSSITSCPKHREAKTFSSLCFLTRIATISWRVWQHPLLFSVNVDCKWLH
jgi:hypothetical protein